MGGFSKITLTDAQKAFDKTPNYVPDKTVKSRNKTLFLTILPYTTEK